MTERVKKLVEWSREGAMRKEYKHEIRAISIERGWVVLHLKKEISSTSTKDQWEVVDDWPSDEEPSVFIDGHDRLS